MTLSPLADVSSEKGSVTFKHGYILVVLFGSFIGEAGYILHSAASWYMPTSTLPDHINEGVLSFWYLLVLFIGESIPVRFLVVESSLEGLSVMAALAWMPM